MIVLIGLIKDWLLLPVNISMFSAYRINNQDVLWQTSLFDDLGADLVSGEEESEMSLYH